ncbi:MAG: acyl-CoA thioesterase [Myxococcales bacterium FL481]|nr:MAG: acyl-CoA thioesterase [Myxococcales bacterium FL481]
MLLLGSALTDPRPVFPYSLEMSVRDYECDLQGIVNNSVYQNYLEHARHEFLRSEGIDFAELTARGVLLVVIRAELDYRHPLRSGDRFRVRLRVARVTRLRFAFWQEIARLPDDRLIVEAKIVATGLSVDGRPAIPPEIERLVTADSSSSVRPPASV